MAVAILAGKGGSVAWATESQADDGVVSWTFEATVSIIETTDLTDTASGWREYLAGRLDWTATVDTHNTAVDPSTVANADAVLQLKTSEAASDLILQQAICSGMNIGMDSEGLMTATYTFVSAGDPTPP